MRIVDPTTGTVPDALAATIPNDVTIPHAAVGVGLCGLSNSKPGAREMLTEIGRRLESHHHLGPAGLEAKPSAAVGADPALLDHLAAQYRTAVVAIGD